MSGGNLKRPGGPWAIGDTFLAKEPDDSIPKKGWAVVGGPHASGTCLYHDGDPVKNVRSFDYEITAGGLPVLKIEIIAPKIKMVTEGLKETRKGK